MVWGLVPSDAAIFLVLILLEGVLSFDNAAVIAAMARRLEPHQRRKALFYGIAGAYVFRVGAIFAVAFLIENPWLKLVGGGYLLVLAVRHLWPGEHHHKPLLARFGISGFWGVVISIEAVDLVFALDQILVAVAMTDKIPLIIAASLVAILFLRLSATYIARLMDWFPQLEKFAYLAVGFVGVKLVGVEVAHMAGATDFEVPKLLSVGVTFSLLVLPVLVKLLLDWRKRRAGPPAPSPP